MLWQGFSLTWVNFIVRHNTPMQGHRSNAAPTSEESITSCCYQLQAVKRSCDCNKQNDHLVTFQHFF